MPPESGSENIINLSTERATREIESLKNRLEVLRNEVDQGMATSERLGFKADNIESLTKKREIASNQYETEDETLKKIIEITEIENKIKALEEGLNNI